MTALATLFVCVLLVGSTVGAAAGAPFASDPASNGDLASGASGASGATSREQVAPPAVNETTAANGTAPNETVPVVDHEDPRTALGRGSVQSVDAYLVGSMSNRLAGSTRLLNRGEYPEARAVLGADYESLYERYDDVRGDVGTRPEDAARFAVVRDEQLRYIDAVERYGLVREDYLEARRDADSFHARRLAREMELQAETVAESRDNLVANYTLMTAMGGDRQNETVRLVDRQADRVRALQSTVRDQQFVDTRLEISVPNTTGSFASPYRLLGRVTTADGTPLSNETGWLTVGGQRSAVETDANGTFAVLYRPTTVPDGPVTVEARFVVDEQSAYLGDRTTVELFVRQETPTVTVATQPTVGFGDELVVSGVVGGDVPNATRLQERTRDGNVFRDRLRAAVEAEARMAAATNATPPVTRTLVVDTTGLSTVSTAGPVTVAVNVTDLATVTNPSVLTAENATVVVNETAVEAIPLPPALREPLPTEFVGAANVSLLVVVGDRRLGTAETGTDGTYRFTTTVPPDIRRGSQPVRVVLVDADRALAPTAAATSVAVRTTPTRVRLDETVTRGRELLVAGTLATADGTPLPGQQVELRVDGGVVETARTDDDGAFAASLSLPDRDGVRTTVSVVAGFDTPTTNLAPAESAPAVVGLPEPRVEPAAEVPAVARLREALGVGEVLVVLPVVDLGVSPDLLAGTVGLVVVGLGVLVAVASRRRRTGPVSVAGRRRLGDAAAAELLRGGRPDPTDATDPTPPGVYLRAARSALAASNPRLATEYAYVAARRQLSAERPLPRRVTHREFLRAVREGGYEVADAVSALTTAYERAAFSPHGVADSEAERAISAAEVLVN
ncbi:DUF4129 domain-containing protein [Salinigranum marinum]|uniref:DUF4129 domain-containing protein n=1 Tax=Salinigranum marinum TaxID=1515595 RepID=UPI002989BFD4|nr:DUF4129 domain-containing protein [Salinigranum marinum]